MLKTLTAVCLFWNRQLGPFASFVERILNMAVTLMKRCSIYSLNVLRKESLHQIQKRKDAGNWKDDFMQSELRDWLMSIRLERANQPCVKLMKQDVSI